MEPIKPAVFYGEDMIEYSRARMEKTLKNAMRYKYLFNRMPETLMGPTQFWEQFRRQADALETAAKQSEIETVCTFVCQKESGYREFIVAHPEVFWFYTSRMPNESRCFYEVIPEGAPCWLYFDLEFMLDLNPGKDGPRMTDTVIKIFCSYLEKYWGLSWDEKNVLNLDSTTSSKFSRHLIFCKKDVAFCNNFHVGGFVKGVCREITEYLDNSSVFHDVLSHHERKELEQLFVETSRGKKIFIDTSVYTRNRHFRIYKSTKWGKLSNLVVAPESKHVPTQDRRDKQLSIFLDSLISFFPDKKNLSILEIKDSESIGSQSYAGISSRPSCSQTPSPVSLYPLLDKFILSLVKPGGKIRLTKYIKSRGIILYEIIGNRYCANIRRQHKSNNIYWTADLRTKKVYQKCHDEDCANFTSDTVDIPLEVSFQIDDEEDELFLNVPADECDHSDE